MAPIALCAAASASAQVSGSLSIASDQRFRGYTLSGERPVASLGVFYDHSSGAYAGVSATGVDTKGDGIQLMSVQGNLGLVRRLRSGMIVDMGLTRAEFSRHSVFGRSARYTEAYLGLLGKNLSTRIYLSPHYFRPKVSTFYVEVDGSMEPLQGWRLIGHLGMLTQIGGPRRSSERPRSVDWRLGISRQLGSFDLHLSWIGRVQQPRSSGPERYDRRRLVAGVTYTF